MFNFILKCLIHTQKIWICQFDLQVSYFMSRNELKFYMKYFIVHLEILFFQIVVANMGIFLG